MYFDYEYYCGANVVMEMDGVQVTELSGISFSVQETKRPIYGYSSRHFDAVARGQVLVRGTLLVPFVHRDYLFNVMKVGKGIETEQTAVQLQNIDRDLPDGSEALASVVEQIRTDPVNANAQMKALQAKYWDLSDRTFQKTKGRLSGAFNPHDVEASFDIKITFGLRDASNAYGGEQNLLISDAYILSRGTQIQISEDCIMEEYGFFARNLWTLSDVEVEFAEADMQVAPNDAKVGIN